MIRLPASKVVPAERYAIVLGILKIISLFVSEEDGGIHFVFVSWTTLPLWIDFIVKL